MRCGSMIAVGLAVSLVGTAAHACPPPPPPPAQLEGEDDAAYQQRLAATQAEETARFRAAVAKRQADLWTSSPVILVAEVKDTELDERIKYSAPARKARLRPIEWIRGTGSVSTFWLRYAGDSDCGPYGGGDAVAGKPGERFVVFAAKPPRESSDVIDSIGRASALDERVIAALSDRGDRAR